MPELVKLVNRHRLLHRGRSVDWHGLSRRNTGLARDPGLIGSIKRARLRVAIKGFISGLTRCFFTPCQTLKKAAGVGADDAVVIAALLGDQRGTSQCADGRTELLLGLKDGRVREMGIDVGSAAELDAAYQKALAHVPRQGPRD